MSLSQSIQAQVKEIAQEICDREGLALYDVEYLQGQKVLRIFIDKDVKGGVSLEDCAVVSKGVNILLDIEDPIANKYNLEVSSPGLERHLSQEWHYKAQIGKRIKVIIKARTETAKSLGKKEVEGILKDMDEKNFMICTDKKETLEISFEDVHKCNLVFNF